MSILITEDRAPKKTVAWRMLIGLLVAAVFLIPYLVMFVGSLKTQTEILAIPPDYLPREGAQWSNYLTKWDTPETPVAYNLISTIVISLCATLLVLLVATPAAYYTARFKFPGKMVFMFLVIVTQMLQPAALTTGLFKQMLAMNLYDTWLAMILINAAVNLAFAVWMMHSFFAGCPRKSTRRPRSTGRGNFECFLESTCRWSGRALSRP